MQTNIIKTDPAHRTAINYDGTSYFNDPCTVNIDGVKYIIGAGTSDRLTTVIEGNIVYILGENSPLNYISLVEINTDTKEVNEAFLNDNGLPEDIFELSTMQQIKFLTQYLPY